MTGMQWTWVGQDGSVWDLTSGRVRLDKRPVQGVGEPDWERSVRRAAGRSGQRRTTASTAKAREGFLPFLFAETDAAARVATENAWWASWDPDVPGVLSVTQPSGSTRSISACLSDDNDYSPSRDPYMRGTDKLGVSWVGDSTWWRGPAVIKTFGQAAATNFFGPTGYGPPFNIGSSNVLGNALLTNSGDIDAPVLITAQGPLTAFDFSIDGHRVAGPVTALAGQSVEISSATDRLSTTLVAADGTRTLLGGQLTSADYARIPHGKTVPLVASLTGSGTVTVRHEPRYKRAW